MNGEVEALLQSRGALLRGHFLLSSGLHSDVYVEKFELVQHPDVTVPLCSHIAQHYSEAGVQTVAGPTTGGAILAFETARQMGVRSIFAERSPSGGREFRRGFKLAPGERVLVVDDVLTTGGSVRATVAAIEVTGAVVVGAGVLIDRSGGAADAGTGYFAALTLKVPTYDPSECPQCLAGVRLEKRGSSPL